MTTTTTEANELHALRSEVVKLREEVKLLNEILVMYQDTEKRRVERARTTGIEL
jgi:hypothetical protein